MGYYPILDRTPKGRDEDDGFQLWIRRHDEYDGQRNHENAQGKEDRLRACAIHPLPSARREPSQLEA